MWIGVSITKCILFKVLFCIFYIYWAVDILSPSADTLKYLHCLHN